MPPIPKWTIFPDVDRWQVARATPDGAEVFDVDTPAREPNGEGEPGSGDAKFNQVAQTLHQNGYAGEGLLLAIPSHYCLALTLGDTHDGAAGHQQALAFALEQHFPVAAEEFVPATVESQGGRLAVVVATAPVGAWISGLEAVGVVVQSIAPAALLALEDLSAHDDGAGPHVVLWHDETRLECFLVTSGKPRAWEQFAADPATLARHLRFLALNHARASQRELGGTSDATSGTDSTPPADVAPLRVTAFGLAPDLLAAVAELPDFCLCEVRKEPLRASAAIAAGHVLQGSVSPWVDFRSGALASADPYRPIAGPLRFARFAAVACLAVVAATMFYRAHLYRRVAAEYHERQAEVFRKAFPRQAVPAGILSRLTSEYGKLTAANSAPSPARSRSALTLLHRLLAGLPQDVRYRLFEIRLEDGRIDLDGEVLSHGDADRIASRLRTQELQVEAPHSQQLPNQAVSVRLTGSLTTLVTSKQGQSR